MPNYYNPYNFYPVSYQGYSGNIYPTMQQPVQVPQQNFSGAVQQAPKMMEWVEGEVGAKAFQMPNGWPANSPIPLWDSTDTVIYLKSWGPMGIPNPMQKLRYEMPEQSGQQNMLMSGSAAGNGNEQNKHPENNQYVTKQDLEGIKREMMAAINSISGSSGNNQNGSNSNQNNSGNRGGNR